MKVKLFLMVKSSLFLINKFLFILIFTFFFSTAYSEGYVKASESLIWDSENQNYTANGDVEFKNEKFIAYSDKMIAKYIEENNEEIFTIVELFENVVIYFEEEIFKGNHAIYTRENNLIVLTGDVSIEY